MDKFRNNLGKNNRYVSQLENFIAVLLFLVKFYCCDGPLNEFSQYKPHFLALAFPFYYDSDPFPFPFTQKGVDLAKRHEGGGHAVDFLDFIAGQKPCQIGR